jgi:pimeloyl-CoA synthetase
VKEVVNTGTEPFKYSMGGATYIWGTKVKGKVTDFRNVAVQTFDERDGSLKTHVKKLVPITDPEAARENAHILVLNDDIADEVVNSAKAKAARRTGGHGGDLRFAEAKTTTLQRELAAKEARIAELEATKVPAAAAKLQVENEELRKKLAEALAN